LPIFIHLGLLPLQLVQVLHSIHCSKKSTRNGGINMSCRRDRDDRDNVAGVSDRNRDRNRDVRFRGTIDGDDFCRAVRRCLNDDRVAGAEDDRRRNRCRWF
jgi:hypothetical protein